MTQLDQPPTQAAPQEAAPQAAEQQERPRRVNVGNGERIVSVAAGAILAALGIARRSVPGMIVAGIGGAMLFRGASGQCAMYKAMGISTARSPQEQLAKRGIHIEQAVLINKSPEELYRYWRNFENLPRIMSYLESVRVIDDKRSHWVAKAPFIAGGSAEWDAEITRDEPNVCIAWRSTPDSEINNAGQVRFDRAPGDRGTEIHVFLDYLPPGGRLGHWVASLFGKSPDVEIREDLRNFKRIMETGELPTIAGQPHGTCTA